MDPLSRKDQAAIRRLWKSYKAAFNGEDARSITVLHAADGDLVSADGVLVTGAANIETFYEEQFAVPGKLTVRGDEISPAHALAADVALVNGSWTVSGVGPRPISVLGTFVVRRENGSWSYVAVRFMVPFGA